MTQMKSYPIVGGPAHGELVQLVAGVDTFRVAITEQVRITWREDDCDMNKHREPEIMNSNTFDYVVQKLTQPLFGLEIGTEILVPKNLSWHDLLHEIRSRTIGG